MSAFTRSCVASGIEAFLDAMPFGPEEASPAGLQALCWRFLWREALLVEPLFVLPFLLPFPGLRQLVCLRAAPRQLSVDFDPGENAIVSLVKAFVQPGKAGCFLLFFHFYLEKRV